MIDSLEQRRLLALPVSGGIVTINGTASNDVLEIVVSGGVLQLRNSAGTVINSVSASGVTGAVVNAGDGNDFVRFGRADGSLMPNLNATIRGNPGNDTLIGTNRDDQIFGDIGDDRLDGRAGRDLLDGSSGFDTADYAYRTVPLNVTLSNSSVANDGANSGDNSAPSKYNDLGADNVANMEAVLGGSAADRLVGSSSANWFDGGGANDSIFGGAGIDTIYGGASADLAYGEGDTDWFFVQDGAGDHFLGGLGTTYAQYDSSLDSPAPALSSSPSSLSTGLVDSSSTGSSSSSGPKNKPSDTWVDVSLTPEEVQALDLTYAEKPNRLKSIPEFLQKRLKALKPDGTLEIEGTIFDDLITVSQEGDTITVNVSGELYDASASLVTRVVIFGLAGNDQIVADPSLTVPVLFDGGDGDDSMSGGSAGDELRGGAGADRMWGGAGGDSLAGQDGDDLLLGEAGPDQLTADAGRDILIGGADADVLHAGDGEDLLIGGYTLYDRDPEALAAIAAEWTFTGRAYQNRVANLNGTGAGNGLNGSYYLRPGGASSKTVFDDGVTDVMFGQGDTDWFIAATRDFADVLDREPGEHLTQL
jgi:Ca2+-binding RTX toxin-like protein